MRQAGILPDETQADTFVAYLLTQGITAKVEQTPSGWLVWVREDQHWERSREELAQFSANPNDPRYQGVQKQAREIQRQRDAKQKQYADNVVDVRRRWQPWTTGAFPLTIGLIVVSVAVYLFKNGTVEGPSFAYRWLYVTEIFPAGNRAPWDEGLEEIQRGQVWRLITPIFMHRDLIHLLFNMYMTYQFGALIETRRGSLRLLLIVLFTAACSNLAQYVYGGPLFLGMSGVDFGLFGYVWMKSRFDPSAGIRIEHNLVIQLLVFLVLCLTGLLGTIANMAHFVGLVSGMAVGYAPVLWRKVRIR